MTSTITPCCRPISESALDSEQADQLAGWFSALADPTRLRLFSMIAAREEVCACELAGPLGISQPTVSHHLKVLHEVGLLDRNKRGREVNYRSVPGRLSVLSRALRADADDNTTREGHPDGR
jgi:ArsR family transcriptional regulator